MSVLLIDAGNTRLKWQLRSEGRVLETASSGYDGDVTEKLPQADKVVVASVGEHAALHHSLQRMFAPRLIWLSQPAADSAAFVHCYSDPARLGVDRWLAMLGARRHCTGAVMVADAGTALTVDLLTADNRHQGGYIVPGLRLGSDALFSNTGRVRAYVDEESLNGTAPGQDTLSCVMAGMRRQAQALVAAVQADYPDYHLLVTGGDGRWLAQALAAGYVADLVFDGMDSLCAGSFLA